MNQQNVDGINTPMQKCSYSDMVDIQPSYTENDVDDFENAINGELKRHDEIVQHEINDMNSDPALPKVGQGPDVYIGFDSEFLSGKKGEDNTVLSLQFYLVGECGVLPKIVYPRGLGKSERPSFDKTISGLILEALEKAFHSKEKA